MRKLQLLKGQISRLYSSTHVNLNMAARAEVVAVQNPRCAQVY